PSTSVPRAISPTHGLVRKSIPTSVPTAWDADMPVSCSPAGFRPVMRPVWSRTITPSSIEASTSAQGARGSSRSGASGVGLAPTASVRRPNSLLEVVLTRGVVAAVVRLASGLQLLDHLVEVVAGLLAELLPHLAHPAGHALGVLLVEPGERGVVGERVEPAPLRPSEGEARHQAGERAAAAALAHRIDRLADAQREDRHLPLAARAAVLVDGHPAAIIAASRPQQPVAPSTGLPGARRARTATKGAARVSARRRGVRGPSEERSLRSRRAPDGAP